jgi:hypothetical protein
MDAVKLFVYDELKDVEILSGLFGCSISTEKAQLKEHLLGVYAGGEYFL